MPPAMHSGAVSRPEKCQAAGRILVALIFYARSVVGMAGTRNIRQVRIIGGTRIRVADDRCNRRPAGDAVYKPAKKLRNIGFFARRGKF